MGDTTWDLLLGPAAALVLALIVLYAIVKTNVLVPGKFYEESEKRAVALEAENKALDDNVGQLTEAIAGYREQLASNTAELKFLKQQIEQLKSQLASLGKGG